MFVEVTPIAIKKIYYRYYIVLAALNCFNAAVIWAFYPETARKSLEEIDFYFANEYGKSAERAVTETRDVKGKERIWSNLKVKGSSHQRGGRCAKSLLS